MAHRSNQRNRSTIIERAPIAAPIAVLNNPSPAHAWEILQQLARAVLRLSDAVDRQSAVLEILQEAMPATTEADILGISAHTVRRRRRRRAHQRLLQSV